MLYNSRFQAQYQIQKFMKTNTHTHTHTHTQTRAHAHNFSQLHNYRVLSLVFVTSWFLHLIVLNVYWVTAFLSMYWNISKPTCKDLCTRTNLRLKYANSNFRIWRCPPCSKYRAQAHSTENRCSHFTSITIIIIAAVLVILTLLHLEAWPIFGRSRSNLTQAFRSTNTYSCFGQDFPRKQNQIGIIKSGHILHAIEIWHG